MNTAKKNAAAPGAQSTQAQSSTYEQILRATPQEREEQALQYAVQDNLNTLMEDIKATGRALDTAKRYRTTMLQSTSVDWSSLGKKDKEIEGYEAGLTRLKSYRQNLFPNWKTLVAED